MANIYELPVGAAIQLEGEDYSVTGGLELEQLGYRWKEYNLLNKDGKVFWLSVEKWPGPERYMLSWALEEVFSPTYKVLYNSLWYEVTDAGFATVVGVEGNEDGALGERVFFKEYLFNMPDVPVDKEKDILLSYESWEGTEEFSGGRYLYEDQIVAQDLDFSPVGDSEKLLDLSQSLTKLTLGTFLTVKGISYYVASRVENKQKNYVWWEYLLKKEDGDRRNYWLSVETYDHLNLELSTPITYSSIKYRNKKEIAIYEGEEFELLEQGRANVVSFTHGDYDHNERFNFLEYINTQTGRKLSIESWEDENEASVGFPLSVDEVTVDHTKEKKAISKQSSDAPFPLGNIIAAFIITSLCVFLAISPPWLRPTIGDQLAKDSTYIFVTYVTLNDEYKTKGTVYATMGGVDSLDAVTKNIISMDPENVKSVYSSTESEGGTLIITSREQVLIYSGESPYMLYIQVSGLDKYPELATAPYQAKDSISTSRFYHRSYTRYRGGTNAIETVGVSDSAYSAFTASARNSSIASRQSSGGGTGFGK